MSMKKLDLFKYSLYFMFGDEIKYETKFPNIWFRLKFFVDENSDFSYLAFVEKTFPAFSWDLNFLVEDANDIRCPFIGQVKKCSRVLEKIIKWKFKNSWSKIKCNRSDLGITVGSLLVKYFDISRNWKRLRKNSLYSISSKISSFELDFDSISFSCHRWLSLVQN